MNRGAVMKWMYDYAKSNELMVSRNTALQSGCACKCFPDHRSFVSFDLLLAEVSLSVSCILVCCQVAVMIMLLFAFVTITAPTPVLQDPSDKRYIIADDTLKNLTGESRFLAFGAQKLFSKHFLK